MYPVPTPVPVERQVCDSWPVTRGLRAWEPVVCNERSTAILPSPTPTKKVKYKDWHTHGDMLRRQFSSCDAFFFANTFSFGDKMLHELHWFEFAQGQNKLNLLWPIVGTAFANFLPFNAFSCLNLFRVHQLPYYPCNMCLMRTHERACPCFTSPQKSPLARAVLNFFW